MSASAFPAAEQYAFTTGLCHHFAKAAQGYVGGTATILLATDPRQLDEHDWPHDEPLHLHVFLTLADGRVVDGEGQRSLDDLLTGFGVRSGFSYQLISDPTWELTQRDFGTLDNPWTTCIEERLKAVAWTDQQIPASSHALKRKKDYDAAASTWVNEGLPRYKARVAELEHPGTATQARASRPRR